MHRNVAKKVYELMMHLVYEDVRHPELFSSGGVQIHIGAQPVSGERWKMEDWHYRSYTGNLASNTRGLTLGSTQKNLRVVSRLISCCFSATNNEEERRIDDLGKIQ